MVTFTATTTHQLPQSAAFDMTNGQRDRQTDSREECDNFEPYGDSRRARASSMSSSGVRSFYGSTSFKLSTHIVARSATTERVRQRERARSLSAVLGGSIEHATEDCVNCTQNSFLVSG